MPAGRVTFFTGRLLDAEDFRLEQEAVRDHAPVELSIRENGSAERWVEVADLGSSGPGDAHFTLDRETGLVRFGDGEHGRRPQPGSAVEASYRRGRRIRGPLLALPFVAGLVTAVFRRRR